MTRVNKNGHVRRDAKKPLISSRVVPWPARDNLNALHKALRRAAKQRNAT